MFVRSFFLHFHLWTIINANINLWGNSSYHHRQYICQTLFANIQYVPSADYSNDVIPPLCSSHQLPSLTSMHKAAAPYITFTTSLPGNERSLNMSVIAQQQLIVSRYCDTRRSSLDMRRWTVDLVFVVSEPFWLY